MKVKRPGDAATNSEAIRCKAVDARNAAFDRDEVRCTGGCLLMPEMLHPTAMQSDALASESSLQMQRHSL